MKLYLLFPQFIGCCSFDTVVLHRGARPPKPPKGHQ